MRRCVATIAVQAFYNDAINDELESEDLHARLTVGDEYHRWRQDLAAFRQRRSGSSSARRYEVRSIICYPFVLDPSVKVRITIGCNCPSAIVREPIVDLGWRLAGVVCLRPDRAASSTWTPWTR